ncbi:MAG: hypothetical protein AB9866_06720 [Syntrophobacteraceae bacterium]
MRTSLIYQYQFTDSWRAAAIAIDTEGETKKVYGVKVNPIPRPLEELNAFTFSGKRFRHYFGLVFAAGELAFILSVLILCIRTKMRKRKWLWILFEEEIRGCRSTR